MWECIQLALTLFLRVTQTTANVFVVGPLTATDNPNNCAAELGSRGSAPPPTGEPAVGELEGLGRGSLRATEGMMDVGGNPGVMHGPLCKQGH